METALKINPSLCVSSPPAWAQPFTVRGRLSCIRPGHISLFLYNQINLNACNPTFGTPGLRGEFQFNSGILVFWQELQGAEIRTLGPVISIRTKNKNSWYASKGCRNWDPGCGSAGAVQRGRSWVNIPKTLNRASTVRAPCDSSPLGNERGWRKMHNRGLSQRVVFAPIFSLRIGSQLPTAGREPPSAGG